MNTRLSQARDAWGFKSPSGHRLIAYVPAELEAARLMLQRFGVTPDQLLAVAAVRDPAPTFAGFEPTRSEIKQLCEQVRTNVVVWRNTRGGRKVRRETGPTRWLAPPYRWR